MLQTAIPFVKNFEFVKKMQKVGMATLIFCIILSGMECRPANRLANEKSPYLLQHAHNPVDWYPWGDEAFAKATKENKPIFLSIGYSTCHWCHVMERESFENEKIAEILNKNFVSIKVDREERPDIDHEYMQVCQLLSPSCGWPLTIIMTPKREPFFAATYLPPTDRRGMRGLAGLLPEIVRAYHKQPEKIQGLVLELRRLLAQRPREAHLNPKYLFQTAFAELQQRYDSVHGGFGTAPKFPSPHNLSFLLHYGWHQSNSASPEEKRQGDEALAMAFETLKKIRLSGTYDQLGYGFHRYATDPAWRVPHFEKMLYDQAMLLLAYADAIRILQSLENRQEESPEQKTPQATNLKHQSRKRPTTKDGLALVPALSFEKRQKYLDLFIETTNETIQYLTEIMRDPKGGFYTAEDADSEGEEGTFYIWDYEEVAALPDGKFLLQAFGLQKGGVSQELAGKNTLIYPADWQRLAASFGISEKEARLRLEQGRRLLYEKRKERPRPFLDKKILTDTNGLLIAALSRAALVLQKSEYADVAKQAADFLLENLQSTSESPKTSSQNLGRLLHRYYEGKAGVAALLDDYSFLVFGLTELYMATNEVRYLKKAIQLNQEMLDNFYDAKAGGFFHAPNSQSPAFVAAKPLYDGAIPSGNSVALYNLIRLSRIADKPDWEKAIEKSLAFFSSDLANHPSAFSQLLLGLLFEKDGKEIVIAVPNHIAISSRPFSLFAFALDTKAPEKVSEGSLAHADKHIDKSNNKVIKKTKEYSEATEMLRLIFKQPDALLLYHNPELAEVLPFTKEQGPRQNTTTIYVCQNRVCRYPANTASELKRNLYK